MIDISPIVLRKAYEFGALKPSEVVECVFGRLGDPDQEAVWLSTTDAVAAMDAARALDARTNSCTRA